MLSASVLFQPVFRKKNHPIDSKTITEYNLDMVSNRKLAVTLQCFIVGRMALKRTAFLCNILSTDLEPGSRVC